MRTEIAKLDPANPDAEKIKDAAALLDTGALVAFPTETVYGIACRAYPNSLKRLTKLKDRTPEKPYTLHIASKDDLQRYVPHISLRQKKLVERTWPGPLTILFDLNENDIALQRTKMPEPVCQSLYSTHSIGIRCPDNPIATLLLQHTENPVVAPSANLTGRPPAADPDMVLAQFSGQIELLLDAGPCKYQKSSSVVKITPNGIHVLRHGIYSRDELETLAQVNILVVCTGNTCRSPMAEGMFRKYLAEKLGCALDELPARGYKVTSAGVIDTLGFPASPEAVAACAARGVDIAAHRSNRLSEQVVRQSDLIFAMATVHCERVAAVCPEAAGRCRLLADNQQVPDPIGQPQDVYDACADLIEKSVKKRIGEFLE